VMERKYRVTDFTWTNQAQDVEVYHGVFPYDLLHVATNLQDKLQRFCFMRANVRLEFRISATTFHYGTLLIAWLPQSQVSNCWKLNNIWTASTCNAVVLSANTNTSVSMVIPYISPRVYWNHADNTREAYFGQVSVRVLNPLLLQGSASTPSVVVSVFANFENVEMAGMTIATSSFLTSAKERSEEMKKKS